MIADKLKLLIENTDLREQMGKESFRLYLENFTEEKMIEKYTSVFNILIANGNWTYSRHQTSWRILE